MLGEPPAVSEVSSKTGLRETVHAMEPTKVAASGPSRDLYVAI